MNHIRTENGSRPVVLLFVPKNFRHPMPQGDTPAPCIQAPELHQHVTPYPLSSSTPRHSKRFFHTVRTKHTHVTQLYRHPIQPLRNPGRLSSSPRTSRTAAAAIPRAARLLPRPRIGPSGATRRRHRAAQDSASPRATSSARSSPQPSPRRRLSPTSSGSCRPLPHTRFPASSPRRYGNLN